MFQQFLKFTLLATLSIYCMPTSATTLIENRIIGGESVEINSAPYLVSIRYKKNNSTPFEHRCSGTIYSSKVILTTATCVIGLDLNRLHVKAGSTYRSQNDGFLYLVEKYIIHPEYNIWFTDNDLALLVLAFDLTSSFPKEIDPIALLSNVPPVNSLATIAGWGITDASANSKFSEILQIAHVNVVDILDCKRSYGENRISPAMLCATGDDSDACLGDAGGALVYEDKALGLISWGNGCANSDFPGVYTNLVYFKEWIENEVAKL
ncbi:trypsin eta-like [Calliphora vicina]|uniref:trypsin eta-like n=1 Tax=Calliphora vicina TaxID=7373 RepID=UPI00325AF2C3